MTCVTAPTSFPFCIIGLPLGGFWFWYDGAKMEEYFDKNGFIKSVQCGDSKIMCLDVPAFANEWYRQLRYHPEDWMKDIYSSWVRKYDIYNKKGE